MTCLAAVALLHRSRPARVPAREAMSRMGMALRVLATGKPAPDPGQTGDPR
jgi:hypothetical protein